MLIHFFLFSSHPGFCADLCYFGSFFYIPDCYSLDLECSHSPRCSCVESFVPNAAMSRHGPMASDWVMRALISSSTDGFITEWTIGSSENCRLGLVGKVGHWRHALEEQILFPGLFLVLFLFLCFLAALRWETFFRVSFYHVFLSCHKPKSNGAGWPWTEPLS